VFSPPKRFRRALTVLAIPLIFLSCEKRETPDESDIVTCNPQEGNWQAWVMAPDELVYPVGATRYGADGDSRRVDAESLLVGGDDISVERGTLVFDFGQNVAGYVELGVRGAADLSFDLRFSEASEFVFDTELRPYERVAKITIPFVWLPEYHEHRLDGNVDFRDPVQVGAYRYVRMDVHGGAARLDYVRVRFTSFRSTPEHLDGYFLCDDDLLNLIWYAGVYTLDLDTIRTDEGYSTCDETIGKGEWSVVDGSKRDRMIWAGDLFVGSRVDFVSRRDHRPSLDSLDYLGEHQLFNGLLPGCSPVGAVGLGAYAFLEYNLFWILTAWDQFVSTGDLGKLDERYPVVRKALGHIETRARGGLIDLNIASSGTWCWSLARRGKASFVNVLYQLSLRKAALMAEALGHLRDAEEYRKRASLVATQIDQLLWDEGRGIYVESDSDRVHVPLDANAMAILSGIAEGKEQRILDYLAHHHDSPFGLVNVDPAYEHTAYGVGFHNRRAIGFPNYFAAQAMFEMGDAAGALELMRRCFGHMAASEPASTMWEFIGADGRPEMSYIGMGHVWSAGATVLLSQYVLGIRPLEPGYRRFVIDPRMGDLGHVEGKVPTPFGPIFAKLDVTDDGLLVYLKIPEGTEAELDPPDGYTSWRDSDGARGDVTGGTMTIPPGSKCILFTGD